MKPALTLVLLRLAGFWVKLRPVASLAGMLVGGTMGSAFRTWVRVHPD